MRAERLEIQQKDQSIPAVRAGKAQKKYINDEERLKMEICKRFIEISCKEEPIMLKDFIDNLEKSIILNVLDKVQGNQKEAAKALGIKYTTLNEKVKKYKIRFNKKPISYSS